MLYDNDRQCFLLIYNRPSSTGTSNHGGCRLHRPTDQLTCHSLPCQINSLQLTVCIHYENFVAKNKLELAHSVRLFPGREDAIL